MKRINAIVDIGNTKVKLAFFNELEISEVISFDTEEEAWPYLKNATALIVSSVRNYSKPADFVGHFHQLGPDSELPFASEYKTPQTLGPDRLALAAAAVQAYPNDHVLVIDAGTCITYDLISKGLYLGGAIAPGWNMRAKAMNQFTGKLPLVSYTEEPLNFPGLTTEECLQLGVQEGFQLEIEGYIRKTAEQYSDLKVVLTGGDAKRFEMPSNYSIFADPNFLLKGLNFILQHNVQQP